MRLQLKTTLVLYWVLQKDARIAWPRSRHRQTPFLPSCLTICKCHRDGVPSLKLQQLCCIQFKVSTSFFIFRTLLLLLTISYYWFLSYLICGNISAFFVLKIAVGRRRDKQEDGGEGGRELEELYSTSSLVNQPLQVGGISVNHSNQQPLAFFWVRCIGTTGNQQEWREK